MDIITKYRWRLLVLFVRLFMVNIEALTQDHGSLKQNENIDVQILAIPDTLNNSLPEIVLDPPLKNGNKKCMCYRQN